MSTKKALLIKNNTGMPFTNGAEIYNDYNDNQVYGEYSHVEGNQNLGGLKAFVITTPLTTSEGGGVTEWALDSVKGLKLGDVCSILFMTEDYRTEVWQDCGSITYINTNTNEISLTRSDGAIIYPHKPNDMFTLAFLAVLEKPNIGTVVAGNWAHSEGKGTKAIGDGSHTEGGYTIASGRYSHSEGNTTKALNAGSHAEGTGTIAKGVSSHTEGNGTEASGGNSHVEGYHTKAIGTNQHVQGRWNIDSDQYAHIVGNGTEEARSNAHTLDWDGNAWFAGDVTTGTNKEKLATETLIDEKLTAFATEREDGSGWDLSGTFLQASKSVYTPSVWIHDKDYFNTVTLMADSTGSGSGLAVGNDNYFMGELRMTQGTGRIMGGANNSVQIWSSENKTWEGDGILTVGEDSLTYTVNTGIDDNGIIVGNTYNIYHEGNKPDLSAILEAGNSANDTIISLNNTKTNSTIGIDGENIVARSNNGFFETFIAPGGIRITNGCDLFLQGNNIHIVGTDGVLFAIDFANKEITGSDEMKTAFKTWLGIN